MGKLLRNREANLKKLVMLLSTLLALGVMACSSSSCGEGTQQPITATTTQSATGGYVGETLDNIVIKVTLEKVCTEPGGLYMNAYYAIENVGSVELDDYSAFFRGENDNLIDWQHHGSITIMPGQIFHGMAWGGLASRTLTIFALGTAGNFYSVKFNLPPLSSIPSCH